MVLRIESELLTLAFRSYMTGDLPASLSYLASSSLSMFSTLVSFLFMEQAILFPFYEVSWEVFP
jgi:hypothetical protein